MDHALEPSDKDNPAPDWLTVSIRSSSLAVWEVGEDYDKCKPDDLRKEFDLPWSTIWACMQLAGIVKARFYDFSEVEAAVSKYGPPPGSVFFHDFIAIAGISEESLNIGVREGAISPCYRIGKDTYYYEEDSDRLVVWLYRRREQRIQARREIRIAASKKRKEKRAARSSTRGKVYV